jgi:hypothetical protein
MNTPNILKKVVSKARAKIGPRSSHSPITDEVLAHFAGLYPIPELPKAAPAPPAPTLRHQPHSPDDREWIAELRRSMPDHDKIPKAA